jgi:hypothetical protein
MAVRVTWMPQIIFYEIVKKMMSRSMRIFGVVWSGLYYQVTTEGMITVCLESNYGMFRVE